MWDSDADGRSGCNVPNNDETSSYASALRGTSDFVDSSLSACTPEGGRNILTDIKEESQEHFKEQINRGQEDSDLQKAIALSLDCQEKPKIDYWKKLKAGLPNIKQKKSVQFRDFDETIEDVDLNKALEESMKSSRFYESSNRSSIEAQRRINNWPVGLINVGNTCWFNSVIQALFNISEFRNLIIGFNPPRNGATTPKAAKQLHFMKELRNLFALLIGSIRKCVNPQRPLDAFKGAFEGGASINAQQDVSEFTSKLFEWVEESLESFKKMHESAASDYTVQPIKAIEISNHDSSGSSEDEHPPSLLLAILKDTFYGELETTGLTDRNEAFEKKETFVQLPLQVKGFKSLYESIDASLQSEFTSNGFRGEQWIRKLPRALILNLNRFIYNPELKQTEKIHDKMQFPEVLYLDRFVMENQELTREKRKQVTVLNFHLMSLQAELEKLQKFGSTGLPVKESLQTVLEYADYVTIPEVIAQDDSSAEMSSEVTNSHEDSSSQQSMQLDDQQQMLRDKTRDVSDAPSALEITVDTLVLWKKKICAQIEDLEKSIEEYQDKIGAIYNHESLKTLPYKLHAVLVHEGHALSGHYWCYVQQRTRVKPWLKFNDTTVSASTLSELQQESFGGGQPPRPTCSAYCLIYVAESSAIDIFDESGNVSLESLPSDLIKYVAEFDESIIKQNYAERDESGAQVPLRIPTHYSVVPERDDVEHSCLATDGAVEGLSTSTITVPDNSSLRSQSSGDRDSVWTFGQEVSDSIKVYNYSLSTVAMKKLMNLVKGEFETGVNSYVQVHQVVNRLKTELEKIGDNEEVEVSNGNLSWFVSLTRLHHIAHMAQYLSLDTMVVNRCLLETFLFLESDVLTENLCRLQRAARRFLDEWTWHKDGVALGQFNRLHMDFFQLYRVVSRFSMAFTHLQECQNKEAIKEFINASEINSQGEWDPKRRMDRDLLFYFIRQSFLMLNQEALNQFQSDDPSEQREGLRVALEYVIPVAGSLCKSNSAPQLSAFVDNNNKAIERVRAEWFSLLSNEIPHSLAEKFQDVVSKLTDENTLPNLACKVNHAILTKFGEGLKLIKVEQLLKNVLEAVEYKNS